MLHTGLTSVTFRRLDIIEIVKLTKMAELESIEWGGDIHVFPGDLNKAKEAAKITLDSDIKISSYGSYYKSSGDFEIVLETALVLGAPVIRVWAGGEGSRQMSDENRAKVVKNSIQIAEMAEKVKIKVYFEYHNHSLTDTPESTIQLMDEINHSNLGVYWQTSVYDDTNTNLLALKKVMPWVGNIHVFQGDRLPLTVGESAWDKYFAALNQQKIDRNCLLEFVKDDDPLLFLEDAKILKKLVEKSNRFLL